MLLLPLVMCWAVCIRCDMTVVLTYYCSVNSEKVGVRPLPLAKLVDNFEGQYEYVANVGSVFTFKTNLHAPRYRCCIPTPLGVLIKGSL